jgi:hypothetical protein
VISKQTFLFLNIICIGLFMRSCLKPLDPVTEPLSLPVVVSDYFNPSGWMGDGEVLGNMNIVVDESKAIPDGARGKCYKVMYTKDGGAGWGGMKWLYPSNNWGTRQGLPISSSALTVTFWAAAEKVHVPITFTAGLPVAEFNPDGWEMDTIVNSLPAEWTKYEIDVTYGVNWEISKNGIFQPESMFGWSVQWGATPFEELVFYVTGIVVE